VKVITNRGELGEGGLKIFDDLGGGDVRSGRLADLTI
jgi:hypothetical protein